MGQHCVAEESLSALRAPTAPPTVHDPPDGRLWLRDPRGEITVAKSNQSERNHREAGCFPERRSTKPRGLWTCPAFVDGWEFGFKHLT
jgi:hypothetical protein